MATSIRQFKIGLYREHLEEASSLYEQQLAYLHDPEVNWPDLRQLEERFEAHIDALIVGSELAQQVCRQPPADAGELHAVLRLFCRQRLKDDAFAMLTALDPADAKAANAAAHALRCEAPPGWREDLLRLLQGDAPHLTHVVARVAGFRRFACEELLTRKLAGSPVFGSADLAWALGRVGSVTSVPLLWSRLDGDDAQLCEAAAISLLRLGDDRVMARAVLLAATHAWARRILAFGGDSRAVGVLLDVLERGADEDTVLALGLLGDLRAVAPLLRLLDDDALSAPAAIALNTITGARLYADLFVPDQLDPDELFEDEREAYERDGTLPTRERQPYGTWVHGPLRDQGGWRLWLDQNKHRFRRDYRWRMGQLYGPSALLECLRCESSPYRVRSATCDELVVRYGLDVPFEVELPVRQQSRFLSKIDSWIVTQAGRFEDGRWYLGGRLQR